MYVIMPRMASFTVTEDAKLEGDEVVQKPVCMQATQKRYHWSHHNSGGAF